MAIFSWTTKSQTTVYTKKASRKKLAGNAAYKLIPEQTSTENVPPAEVVENSGTKQRKR
ncbi:hypothetical protein RFN28_09650 [Mesorhizobium sp. VK24D]|uniref:Uncharacterized protein n=1 Tax=Mesorhizobium album TaxID=3072314 RepID=A0ABU4XVL5_9HYPH|nr:hypothetical protein [Mesorhizobium sp. VK24D]MDX8478742.1 hypothetical protein [Mesorhizobium sp. VK24D]